MLFLSCSTGNALNRALDHRSDIEASDENGDAHKLRKGDRRSLLNYEPEYEREEKRGKREGRLKESKNPHTTSTL